MDEDFRKAALDRHRLPRPGKLKVRPTRRMASQRDPAIAYSPRAAPACDTIAPDPASKPLSPALPTLATEGARTCLEEPI